VEAGSTGIVAAGRGGIALAVAAIAVGMADQCVVVAAMVAVDLAVDT
jgi:hypothetical protein